MQSRMTCEVNGNHVALAGSIDENADLVRLLDHERDGALILDLGGVRFINSIGMRQWIRMQQAAATANIRIELRRLAEPLVHQLNIMPAARGVSMVTSFYGPYECDECDQEHLILLDVRSHGTDIARKQAPAMNCPDCGRAMHFADPPDLYFMFLGG